MCNKVIDGTLTIQGGGAVDSVNGNTGVVVLDQDDILDGTLAKQFLSADKTKLDNQSGTNTGDETTGSIQTKLGTATASTDGYLTSTDWNTFDGKQEELVSGTNIKTIDGSSILGSGNITTGFSSGFVLPWAGNIASIPAGFLYCNGSEVSRTTYANLFTAIGTGWGIGDGSTTFNLPDGRGRTLRGVDNGAGIDPDAGSRAANNGGNSGDNVGSYQDDDVEAHKHDLTATFHATTGDGHNGGRIQLTDRTSFSSLNPSEMVMSNFGGSETRMKNININYIIRY